MGRTNKIHAPRRCRGLVKNEPAVTSLGLNARGLEFNDNEANRQSIYIRQYPRLKYDEAALPPEESCVYLMLEIYYDVQEGQEFRAFNI